MKKKWALSALMLTTILCASAQNNQKIFADDVDFSAKQYTLMLQQIPEGKNPKTINHMSQRVFIPVDDWCSGFFPGSLWYLYRLTDDPRWVKYARSYTESLDTIQYLTWHHDVGFMIGCSYLNSYRIQPNEAYKKVIVQTAKSLCTRFRETAGVIQSWNIDRGWQAQRGWACPVIIDNMMNLELLFEASKLSNDNTYRDIAIKHANTTLENQFRPDGSCYHVVDYDPSNGKVLHRHTAQGYAHESAWARGLAWAIYGYTMCYRYTKDQRYIDRAENTLRFMLTDENMPKDLIPYWDYDAPDIPHEPRDVSAAAAVASALYEMDAYLPGRGYRGLADRILTTLSGPDYRAPLGKKGCFLLMHSVGSIPHNNEIDVPLNYADYYFLEALYRQKTKNITIR